MLYSQVPRYTWFEPRRPTVAVRREVEATTKLTHLRPPFAARMTSYEPEEKYLIGKTALEEAKHLSRSGSSEGKDRAPIKLPLVSPPSTAERGSSKKKIAEDHGLQMARMSPTKSERQATTYAKQAQLKTYQRFEDDHMSGPLEPRPSLASSFTAARAQKFHKAPCTSTLEQHAEEAMTSDPSISRYGQPLGRVAPRPSTLLSKHPNNARYVRDTCFFQPTQERKKHYYIVNSNWFSEQRVTIPKNNVFS